MVNKLTRKQNFILAITAIVVIGLLEAFALLQGINGALLSTSLLVIGGIAGYSVKGARRG